jgi:hypothetical protein
MRKGLKGQQINDSEVTSMAFYLQTIFFVAVTNGALFAQSEKMPALKELPFPTPSTFRKDSPFRACDQKLASFSVGQEGIPRLTYLESLQGAFKKQFPKDDAELNSTFLPVVQTMPDDIDHQSRLESLTILLNRLEFKEARLTEPMIALTKSFSLFNSPIKREPKSLGKKDECIRVPSRQFRDYAVVLRDSINTFFRSYDFSAPLVKTLEQTPMLPSGTRVFFGATTTHENDRAIICVNPEEDTILAIPKIMHELVHVNNKTVAALAARYDLSRKKWQISKTAFAAIEAELVKFDDHVDKTSEMDSDNLRELVGDLDTSHPEVILSILTKTNDKNNPYLDLTLAAGFAKQTKLLAQWKSTATQVELDKNEAISNRTELDVERFFDEHGAYGVGLKAAWAMINENPEYFCRAWVPSYQEKRPVRFFQSFEKLESQIYEKTFSAWLANEYSFVASNYLKTSLFPDGEKEKGLKPELEKKGQQILKQEFRM